MYEFKPASKFCNLGMIFFFKFTSKYIYTFSFSSFSAWSLQTGNTEYTYTGKSDWPSALTWILDLPKSAIKEAI